MEAKKNKMCKMRLRRLRPDMLDKLKTKRGITKSDIQLSSSSSESEDDKMNLDDECEQIRVQLRTPITLGTDNDFDPFMLLTQAQAVLKLCSENDSSRDNKASVEELGTKYSKITRANAINNATLIQTNVKPIKKYKHCQMQKSTSNKPSKLQSLNEKDIYDLIYYHSDDEVPCSYNCYHARSFSNTSVLALAPTDRGSSTGSSSSLLSDKCSMQFSKLLENNCISVLDHENPPTALSKILSIKEFDPLAPQQILAIIIKSIVSLAELSQRNDNIICIDIDKRRILEFSAMTPEEKRNFSLNPYMDVSNIVVTHSDDEFLTFCSCEHCEKYREFALHIMVEQSKATHMVVMLLDVLIQSYGPMLKNITAYNKFKNLLDSNKEIYWITCVVIYHKKAEHLDFIYDEYLSDNMIFVLFSSILMLNNPVLLLQILAFHIECLVKAYAEGFLEIVEPDKSKIPADEMINYVLNGYHELMRISEQVASYMFAFENDFLRKFSLTWKLLSQRLYQQHVHSNLADTMLACIITLKEELTSHHTDLIKRYIQFDDIMNYVEKRWTDVWIELNKFNLSEVACKRRKSLLDVYRIFDTEVQDAIGFSMDDNDFNDFRFSKNHRLAWKNIKSFTKMKWPDGYFKPPNTLVVDDRCKTCNVSLEYHSENCSCITCSIAGGPSPPKRNADGKCSKCAAHEIVEKDVNFYDSKILNVCASDDFQSLVSKTTSNAVKHKPTAHQEVDQEIYPTLETVGEMLNIRDYDTSSDITESSNSYHISWAVFNHLNNRKRYSYATIEEKYFCRDCKQPSCLLALKILNNKISLSLSQDLVHYYQPMSMSREELRSILPNIMLYNRKLVASNNGLDLIDVHNLVVKIYWIFIISIYAIYFIDYDDGDKSSSTEGKQKEKVNKCKPSYLDVLELANNDIKVNFNRLTGNKDDTKFLEFLDKIKSLSPCNNDVESNFEAAADANSEEIHKKLNDILKITENEDIPSEPSDIPPPIMTPTDDEEQLEPSDFPLTAAVEAQPKKSSMDKSRKCCFDHSDMGGEYCKENHQSSKKRLKKDCNHVRMNETRDRLRKKLSQIVNAKKNTKSLQLTENFHQTSSPPNSDVRNIMEHILNPEEFKLFQRYLQRSEIWDIQDFVATFDHIYTEAKRNEEKKNLCECLQNFKTTGKGETKNTKNIIKKLQLQHTEPEQQEKQEELQQQQPHESNQSLLLPLPSSLEPPNKKSNGSNNSTRDASTSSQGTKSKENSSTNATTPVSTSKNGNNLDFVSEICEIIDNYSKEQAKRKWIKETLSFIEGPTVGIGKKKIQPQTLNPKKAAKKAKQKQRKDEEKRIAELQDIRAQFHNIYFKEFTEKLNLKSLKANKKRDKKKISETENNIKNLQRAKAKVEIAILELIATVKQTNTEFRFSYLPTKEQQMEKMRELEGHNNNNRENDRTIKVRNLLHQNTKSTNQVAGNSTNTTSSFTVTPTNNLNMVPESYSMPYAHANHFPYNLGFPTPAAPEPFDLMRASPICYAPPSAATVASLQQQKQQLPPDVVAAMAANATSNNTTDPSKRIVTIRRVNLPNVPEPQVTVTAKGPSPDKDKLLYTFINGQLIQTGTAPPITMPQMSNLTQSQLQQTSVSKLKAEHLLSLPPPPPPKLTKTQLKKERKRLAKLQAERECKEKAAERMRIEEEQQRLRELKEQKLVKIKQLDLLQQQQQQQQQLLLHQSKKKKSSQNQQESKPPVSNNKNVSTHNKTKSCSQNTENSEPLKLPQTEVIKNSTKEKQRSESTTTSCSAATSTSSNNSTSSQMNTRDNSVSSIRPLDLKKGCTKTTAVKDKKVGCTQKLNSYINKNIKTNIAQLKQKQNIKPTRIPPTPSTTSSDDENKEDNIETKSPHPSIKTQKQQKQIHFSKTKLEVNKQNNLSQKLKASRSPRTSPSSDTEAEEENTLKIELAVMEHKRRLPKLVNNGQFDNNPFKSLHMQDSETEWSSEEEDNHEDSEKEAEVKIKKRNTIERKLKEKNEIKLKQADDRVCAKTATPSLRKTVATEVKDNNRLRSSTSLTPGNKNAINKSCRSNKNAKHLLPDEKLVHQTVPKENNPPRGQEILLEDERKFGNQTKTLKKTTTQQNSIASNSRKTKIESRSSNATNGFTSETKPNCKHATTSSNIRNEQTATCTINRNNAKPSDGNRNQNKLDDHQNNQVSLQTCGNMENENNSSKRSQRNKKYQQKSQKLTSNQHKKCCSSGIPNHMGYFHANEVNMRTSPVSSHIQQPDNSNTAFQNRSYQTLAEQMQALRLGGHQVQATTAIASAQQRQHINSANVSIMDQLNRGVQVENLSLPPGITLTKVDPIKSEQLRQKSESIKRLAKPLQKQHHTHHLSQNTQTFHHSSTGATIIAPPVVNPIASYYGSSLINANTAGIDPQSSVIMVEANPTPSKTSNMARPNVSSNCNRKQSKNKKRRNKSNANNSSSCPMKSSENSRTSNQAENIAGSGQPKMITLRNPMFHNGPTAATAAILQQPSSILSDRQIDGFPMPVPLPVDQPAAIIKNENGMYTIRNPALHQAVTSGLAMGGYRQFGANVNYYTPQEAAAEAARATLQQQQHHQQQQQQQHQNNDTNSFTATNNTSSSSSYSYFPNEELHPNTPHNNISISCTSIAGGDLNSSNIHAQRSGNSAGCLIGDAAIIKRPPSAQQQRPISAIGSEIKNAQQQKQKTKIEHQWSNFGSDTSLPINKNDNLVCNATFLGAVSEGGANTAVSASGGIVPVTDLSLQEKYQQSKYYNGFDVFTGSSGGSSGSTATCTHIHHSCGDDSPPPSITGYNSYLDGIPNAGVIRYDDASFLKNLIPGQNLNNEVSIHNVNDANFVRNDHSPQTHHVEITQVYNNRPSSTSLYESSTGQSNFRGSYRDTINDYNNDTSTIFPNNMQLNLNKLEYDYEQTYQTTATAVTDDNNRNTILDFKDLLIKNGPTGRASHRTSPYLDDNALEGFVQNMNSLQISNTPCEEQSSQPNDSGNSVRHGTTATNNTINTSNGWW